MVLLPSLALGTPGLSQLIGQIVVRLTQLTSQSLLERQIGVITINDIFVTIPKYTTLTEVKGIIYNTVIKAYSNIIFPKCTTLGEVKENTYNALIMASFRPLSKPTVYDSLM